MKHRPKARVGHIEKFEDRSRELFLNLKRSIPINCQALSPSQRYSSFEGQVDNTAPEAITNNERSSID